jgi:hypothetical protein
MMKRTVFLIVLVLIVGIAHGFAQNVLQRKGATILERIDPPNGVRLYDSVFMDETEISNVHYLEYLHYLEMNSTEDIYNSQLADPDAWEIKLQYKDSTDRYLSHYLRYPGYRYCPVIGVSYEQAMQYCAWRGKVVTENYQQCATNEKCLRKNPDLKNYDVSIEYRLPTKAEWEYAAGLRAGRQLRYGTAKTDGKGYEIRADHCGCDDCLTQYGITVKKQMLRRVEFNVVDDFYSPGTQETIICEDKSFPSPEYIYDGPPNINRLYGMVGNIAEMVLEKGIAKGGSFRQKLSEFDLSTDFHYDEANEWVGFRCVAIVHVKKK